MWFVSLSRTAFKRFRFLCCNVLHLVVSGTDEDVEDDDELCVLACLAGLGCEAGPAAVFPDPAVEAVVVVAVVDASAANVGALSAMMLLRSDG